MTPRDDHLPCPVCGVSIAADATKCPKCNTDFSAVGIGASATLVRLKASEPLDMQTLVDDLVDTLSPRFQGLRRLGHGGMGVVYVARDPLLKRDVAVKLLSPEFRNDASARERFVREAQAAAAVAHPNVVNIYQVGELKATHLPYFVMQYVEGSTVEQAYPRGTAVPEQVAKRITAEVAAALGAAHARGLIHRDVKPSNVMIDPGTGRAIVLDFGISASAQELPRDERLTSTGVYVGTPRYMAPEQASGEGISDKSDVYSLGCVAYELLAGRPVFQAKTALALMAAHMRDTPEALTEARPGIDRELAALVMRCLEKEPVKRPAADEIVRRLAPGGSVLLEWPPPGLEHVQGALRGVSRALWTANALLLVSVLPAFLLGAGLPTLSESTGTLLLVLIGAIGVAVFGVAVARARRLGRRVTDAVRHGYGWVTVLEVIGDVDGEAGLLITGSRRFAALSPVGRSELRRGRVVRAVTEFAAGLTTLPALYVILLLGDTAPFGANLVLGVLLLPATFVWFAVRNANRERLAAPPATRTAAQLLPLETTRLAPAWYEAFDRARTGQPLGAGSRDRPAAGLLSAIAVIAVAVLVVGTLVPVTLVSTLGGTVTASALPRYATTLEKASIAEITRPYTVTRDASISATDAGIAFYALQGLLDQRSGVRPSSVQLLPPPDRRPTPWSTASAAETKTLFPTASWTYWDGPSSAVMAVAVRGASPAQLAYLKAVAEAPHWRDWDRVARARRMDVQGTMFRTPFAEGHSFAELPIPRVYQIKQFAYASALRAAWFISQGKLDSAETSLRTVVSAGFTMSDNANTLIEHLVGIVIVGIGRASLIEYYGLIRNPAGTRLKAQMDSVLAARDQRVETADLLEASVPQPALTRALARRRAVSLANRRNLHRSLRMEFLYVLALSPCTNARELAFGADPDVRAAFDLAKRELVRFPADAAMLELLEHEASIAYEPREMPVVPRLVIGAIRFAGAVLRNPRIAGCTGRILGADMF